LLALSGGGTATAAAVRPGAVGESGDKSPHSKRWREIEYPASDGVRADKAVRAPFVAVVQSMLLALVVLALLVCSATPLTCEAGEVRYRVIKIIERQRHHGPRSRWHQSERPSRRIDRCSRPHKVLALERRSSAGPPAGQRPQRACALAQ